jgi:hypothetical protein
MIDLTTLTETQLALFEVASAIGDCSLDEVVSPGWESSRSDWPRFVGESIRRLWANLPLEARLVACIDAIESAEAELDAGDRFDDDFRD